MFILPLNETPEGPDALGRAIEEGLRSFISRPEKMVAVGGGDASALDSIAGDLSGATIDHHHRPPPPDPSEAIPAMVVRHIYVSGAPSSIPGGDFESQFEAANVELDQKVQTEGECVLSLASPQCRHERFA